MTGAEAVREAATAAARTAYGRLVASLAASSGDLALAEDAVQHALEQALRSWPRSGIPAEPVAWLRTVARNRQRDAWRSAAWHDAPLADDDARHDPLADVDPLEIGDRRLELMFVCGHPAIDARMRAPLMLQAVLGFEARQIAAAFGTSQDAMAARLVRAKRRIKDARIPFRIPDRRDMPERLPAVLEAIYACAAITWRGDAGSLAGEARHLAVTLATLLEHEQEAWALAALITLSLSRRSSDFVPLGQQDPQGWDATLIAEGEALLRRAQSGAPGRFELEAAIQSVHCARRRTGTTDWAALETLHEALLVVAPTTGARIALASIVGRTEGPDAGLTMLEGVEPTQSWWATRADLLRARGDASASSAYRMAAELADDAGVRDHLRSLADEGIRPRTAPRTPSAPAV